MAAMIPEGLQYQSIETIVSRIKSLGMNTIRLTYATEMVDVILSGGDVTVKQSFIKALGPEKGNEIFAKIAKKNPGIKEGTKRLEVSDSFVEALFSELIMLIMLLQVFDAVAAECEKQGIIIHLDNHISKAMWCCNTQDGNSWPGDTHFNTANWKRGWKFMANHVRPLNQHE